MRSANPRTTRRRGVAAVELAFVMPLVLIPLMFGMWEIGRLIEVQQVVSNAAREGGRAASTGQFTNSQVQGIITSYLTNANISTVGVTPTVTSASGNDVSQAAQLEKLTITLSVPYSNVQWLASTYLIPATTTMDITVTYYSMKNIPLTITTSIPGMP